MQFDLRSACEADAADIAALVNRAYRPPVDGAGWTHENKLVGGDRTSASQVRALLGARSAILLLCQDAKIVACVHVQDGQSGACIGMLATDPALQAQGLGKKMLAHAEDYAVRQFSAVRFMMSILTGRPELLAFYERRGYALTGEVGAYPLAASVGRPLVEALAVLSLVKPGSP